MNNLPKMGRPNTTGLSLKALGRPEYHRQYAAKFKRRKTARRWWSGLSRKQLGEVAYRKAFRALTCQRKTILTK